MPGCSGPCGGAAAVQSAAFRLGCPFLTQPARKTLAPLGVAAISSFLRPLPLRFFPNKCDPAGCAQWEDQREIPAPPRALDPACQPRPPSTRSHAASLCLRIGCRGTNRSGSLHCHLFPCAGLPNVSLALPPLPVEEELESRQVGREPVGRGLGWGGLRAGARPGAAWTRRAQGGPWACRAGALGWTQRSRRGPPRQSVSR